MNTWEQHLLNRGEPALGNVSWAPGVVCNFYKSNVEPPYDLCTSAMAVVVTDLRVGKFVLTLNNQPSRGGYEISGGHIDPGETLVVTAARENGEETILDANRLYLARILKIFGYYEITNPPGSKYKSLTYMPFYGAHVPNISNYVRPPTDPEVPGSDVRSLYSLRNVLLPAGDIAESEYALLQFGIEAIRHWHNTNRRLNCLGPWLAASRV